LVYSVTFAGESIELGTECSGTILLTCLTTTGIGPVGTFTVEAKVWDSHAQEWSNEASQDVEIEEKTNLQDDAESEITIGAWVLPIGLGLITLLLIGYMIQSRKD